MTRTSARPYFFLLLALLFLLSFSKNSTERLRGFTAASLAPMWENLTAVRLFLHAPFTYSSEEKFPTKNGLLLSNHEEVSRLQLENQMLRNELNHISETLQNDLNAFSALPNPVLTSTSSSPDPAAEIKQLSQMHHNELRQLFNHQLEAIPARVIFRARQSWDNSFWINVGEFDNNRIGQTVIVKNSPVVCGLSVVGVIDYVGKHQSRVRLITDSGLTPSVRAVRGAQQNRHLIQQVDTLMTSINKRTDLLSPENKKILIQNMDDFKQTLTKNKETWFLAKGELQGSSKPLWRSRSQTLKGTGFNYDFADEEGPARDLRTGKPIDQTKAATLPIIKVNDILMTTGMDGVFPAGLLVAEVTRINPLREGDYYYELEAKPTAGNLDDISTVFVMPAVGFDGTEKPPFLWQ